MSSIATGYTSGEGEGGGNLNKIITDFIKNDTSDPIAIYTAEHDVNISVIPYGYIIYNLNGIATTSSYQMQYYYLQINEVSLGSGRIAVYGSSDINTIYGLSSAEYETCIGSKDKIDNINYIGDRVISMVIRPTSTNINVERFNLKLKTGDYLYIKHNQATSNSYASIGISYMILENAF